MQDGKKKKVAFHTLGCKLNFSESSQIGRQMEDEGYLRVPFGEEADVSVIHTCSVTGSADRKTRQAIKKARQISPNGVTVAMGCYAQLKAQDVGAFEGVDLILGTSEKFDLGRYLAEFEEQKKPIIQACQIDEEDQFFSAQSVGERTRAFLKVQDGCDYSCAYCTIPKARGKSRNPKISTLVEQVESLVQNGILEIVLTGINTGDFGKSTGEQFIDLIQALDQIPGNHRFRISSIEPNLLTKEIILFVKDSQHFAPHFHIPLQSGSDAILKAMRRRYVRKIFAERVIFIHEVMPDAAIGADVIVGFPGEGEEEFADAKRFLADLPLTYLHVFTYSERPGTPAAEMTDPVPNRIRDERSASLHRLSNRFQKKFYESQLGTTREMIPEGKAGALWKGFTENYVAVRVVNEGADDRTGKLTITLKSISPEGQVLAQINN